MIPGFTRTRKCKGLEKSLKTVDLYLPKLVDCRTTWFYFVWRRRWHHNNEFTGRTCSAHCNSLPVVVGVLKFPVKDLDHWTSSSSSLVKPSQTMEFYIDIVYFLILFLAARVVIDRETQRSRGFGFVTFYEERDVQTAIDQLDGQVKRLSTMMTGQETFFSIHLSLGTSTMCILLVRTTKLLVQKKMFVSSW